VEKCHFLSNFLNFSKRALKKEKEGKKQELPSPALRFAHIEWVESINNSAHSTGRAHNHLPILWVRDPFFI
jgi:hypothetical protein